MTKVYHSYDAKMLAHWASEEPDVEKANRLIGIADLIDTRWQATYGVESDLALHNRKEFEFGVRVCNFCASNYRGKYCPCGYTEDSV